MIIFKTLKNYKVALTMLFILVAAILFAIQSQPIQPVKHITPDVVMKRESLELDPAFEEALNVSLKRGYLQGVNWDWAEVA